MPDHWHLTIMQRRVVAALFAADGFADKSRIATAIYFDKPGFMPCQKTVTVYICQIRQRLEKHGITIDSAGARGYRLSSDSRKIIEGIAGGHETSEAQ